MFSNQVLFRFFNVWVFVTELQRGAKGETKRETKELHEVS